MRKDYWIGAALCVALMVSGCGDNDGSPGAAPTTITVLDGYITDGNVTDASGAQGVEDNSTAGLYHFESPVVYPVRFTTGNGRIVGTNMTMDINMSTYIGSVISPVTTLAEDNATIIANLAKVMGGTNANVLYLDYIKENDKDLSKLSQLCYAMLKDTNATQPFLKSITSDFNATADANVTALINTTLNKTLKSNVYWYSTKVFLRDVRDYSGPIANMETNLSQAKKDVAYHYDVNDTTLRSLVNDYTAETNATLKALYAKQIVYAGTAAVTDMWELFNNNGTFNLDISGWDTAHVTDMSIMFESASSFNQPIGNWDTSNVIYMYEMFYGASMFNHPIGDWNTSDVTDMSDMFGYAAAFNQPVGNWDTSNVIYMMGMFSHATTFNQPIGDWNTSNVTSFAYMFGGATDFNRSLNGWDTSKVTNMWDMFDGATAFNQPIGSWDTSHVQNMDTMFYNAISFDQNISDWNVSGLGGTVPYKFDVGSPIAGTSNEPHF